jgi:hypothetical protein
VVDKSVTIIYIASQLGYGKAREKDKIMEVVFFFYFFILQPGSLYTVFRTFEKLNLKKTFEKLA